jgi:hypothetical protein
MLQLIFASEEYSLKIFSYWQIFASKYLFKSEYSQKTLSAYRLQIFAYQRIFAAYCFKLIRKAFHKSKAPQLKFGYFFKKYSLTKKYSLPFLFVSHVKSADSL